MMKFRFLYITVILLAFYACESDDDTLSDPLTPEDVTQPSATITSGNTDFSTFVAIGNSLTAGFSDGTLFLRGQEASLPNMLAGQFALANGGDFTQPLVNDDIGGLLLGGTQIPGFGPRRIFDTANQTPIVFPGTPTTEVSNIMPGPYNNMGVPGAKSFHLLAPGYGNITNLATQTANPYYVRMASAPNATVLSDALSLNPTFVSLWIGNNDVLGYATSGGESDMSSDNFDPITPMATFSGTYAAITNALAATNADGIVSNIPNVTDAPFFTTVPYNPLNPADPAFAAQIPTLNTVYGALNQIFNAIGETDRIIQFSTTEANAVVIYDEELTDLATTITGALSASPAFSAFVQSLGLPASAVPLAASLFGNQFGQARQATTDDLLLLTSSGVIGELNMDNIAALVGMGIPQAVAGQFSANGITFPLRDRWVLIPEEIDEIETATTAFNAIIGQTATTLGWPLFDANAYLNEVATDGVSISGGAMLTNTFVTGGAFSLDGIHPSPRGYAAAANQMIGIINQTYESNLPTVNELDYTGLYID